MDTLLAPAIFVFGLMLGSFLNVCIYRLPRGLSVVQPRSACPGCQRMIPFYDNIPVISWLLLRGRCRSYQIPISVRYLVKGFYRCAVSGSAIGTSESLWRC